MKALIVYLCNSLASEHLLLRRECIACLRQLAQRHPRQLAGKPHTGSLNMLPNYHPPTPIY